YHEIVNALFCIAIGAIIIRSASLLNAYKFTLLPIFFMLFLKSCAEVGYFVIPYGDCYDERPLSLYISNTLFNAVKSIIQFFILVRTHLHRGLINQL
ncbi:hypothetical protein PMAYCL1PPCAC_03062, partial [Pristionchus mayeri]